ncbi:hypothetical protein RA28_05480 [Ruegeria sp. ANG-S4]|uniref:Acg family FMN-binding oxidoreductase n=1 Tax=Ruegeria sp. ANG-S4 TaxID=1577904 RepID=UPI00057D9D22|nr:nitroreductase family protein [Ruegeria sp. ANG-S4]KIC47141.1 hypothetical protein RA28_05480 [Ruegeria sp. ANG-S4]
MPDRQELETFVAMAVLAPSSHNTQPWLFQIGKDCIRLIADRTRALPVNDPVDRELTISCGCALMNLRIVGAASGYGVRVSLFPEPNDEDVFADVEFSVAGNATLSALFDAIPNRHTYRKRFAEREVSKQKTNQLEASAARENAELCFVGDDATQVAVCNLVSEGDRLQWANPSWRRELAQWMHARRVGDGLALPGFAAPVARAIIRRFDIGKGVGASDAELFKHSPLIGVLTTDNDKARDWLTAGQALQRVLLTAAAAGLQVSYLNQPIELPELRTRLANIAGINGVPQILFRIGYPIDAPTKAPRRDTEDVIIA